MTNLNQKLSRNFLLRELLISDYAVRHGIAEQLAPDEIVITSLRSLCTNVLQPLREKLRLSVHVTSGYRCLKVNKAIGGATSSQHIKGQAADIHVPAKSIEWLFQYIKKSGLTFDQLIQEFDSWVHVSYVQKGNRRSVLRATKQRGKTIYMPVT